MTTTCCFPLLLVVALAAVSALPVSQPPAPTRTRPLFDRSQPGPLALVDPLRLRAHGPLRSRADAALRAAPAAGLTADAYMLPTNIRPTYYKLTLTPHLSGNFIFDGQAEIHLNVIVGTKEIVLHSKELTFVKADCEVYSDPADGVPSALFSAVTAIQFDKDLERVTLTLAKPLVAGFRYKLLVNKYTGKLNDDMDGFYRSSYMTSTGVKRWLATTQFEPTGARRAFPCWDEPGYKSRYDISIQHDSKLTAIANMPRLSQKKITTGVVEDVFMTTLPVSSYLVAFIVSDFDSLANDQGNFTTWSRKDILAGGTLSQEVGPKALELLADFNGVPYSLPKMDQAAIPDFSAGAMENWGLVTYREPDLIETAASLTSMNESIATVICHEFGHQWTGDLVTLDWWSHTWLNEGFASFYENMICAQIKPDWNLEDKMLPTFYHVAMESDVRETQVAMSSPVNSYASIEEHFGVISYDKGGSVLRMLYHALTPDVFKKGMKRYLSVNMFKNSNPEQLFHALGVEAEISALHQLPSGVTFSEVASSWTEQPGVPVLGATRDYAANPGRVTFAQQRFLYAPAQDASNVGQKWWIPLVVTTQAKPDFDTTLPQGWLSPDVASSALDSGAAADQWVLVNPKQTGYFRVNYDETNWQLLAAALAAKPADFPAASRAQLLNDALVLARAGQLDYKLALPFLKAVKAERSVAVWQAASAAIKYLLARLDTTDAKKDLLELLKDVTADAYSSVGYQVGATDEHEVAYLRYIVANFACHAGSTTCIADAASALKAWIADPSASPLQPDTKATTLCYGLRGSDATTFTALQKVWQAEADKDVRFTYASALACSADKALVTGLLSDAIQNKYNEADGEALFNALYDNLDNHKALLDFVKENADAIRTAFGETFDVQVLVGLIRDIRSREELTEVRPWVEAKYKSDRDSWSTLDKAFQAAEAELLSWFDKYYTTVSAWLSAADTTTAAPTAAPTSGPNTTPAASCATTASTALLTLVGMLCAALRH